MLSRTYVRDNCINCMPAGCTAYRGGVTNGEGAVAPGGNRRYGAKLHKKYFDTRNTKLSMIVDEWAYRN